MTAFTEADARIVLARRRQILARLQLISDARAGRGPDPNRITMPKGGAGSSPPAEVNLDRVPDSATPPPKERSLFAFYLWQFQRLDRELKAAVGDEKIRAWFRIDMMCSKAMRDQLIYLGKYHQPQRDTDAANVAYILAEYPGLTCEEVAVWEMCDPRWVRKARRAAGLTDLGEERELSDRDQRIVTLAQRGMSQRAIAVQVGCGVATVNRTLVTA